MLPITSQRTPILAPAVGQDAIEAFLEQERAAGRPQPTVRALHARFRGSFTRLARIRRAFLARNTPAAAAAPAPIAPAPTTVDLAPLLQEVERVGAALADLRGELLGRLSRDSDRLSRIDARLLTTPPKQTPPAPQPRPFALDAVESQLSEQDQAIRDLAALLRALPRALTRQQLQRQVDTRLLPSIIKAIERTLAKAAVAKKGRRRRGRRPRRPVRGHNPRRRPPTRHRSARKLMRKRSIASRKVPSKRRAAANKKRPRQHRQASPGRRELRRPRR